MSRLVLASSNCVDDAAGDTANGIVLLYGAGEAWVHVLGDVKLFVPASVFYKFLTRRLRLQFR